MATPEDVVNRALDNLGTGIIIGSLLDGTAESEVARRWYGPTLRQLLRTANWSFARKRAPLQLLADATGQTTTVGTQVEPPWLYAYAWPIDGVRPRWLPWSGFTAAGLAAPGLPPSSGQISIPPNIPIMPNLQTNPYFPFERPARFLWGVSDQYPVQVGAQDWNNLPDLDNIEGVGPNSRRVVYTNVPPFGASGAQAGAQLVYTFLCLEIEVWDDLFARAMDALLASRFAMPLIAGKSDATTADKQRAVQERNNQIAIAKNAIREARLVSSQEAGWPQSTSHQAEWIRGRRIGRAKWGSWGAFGDDDGGAGPGFLSYGWDSFSFADGSVF